MVLVRNRVIPVLTLFIAGSSVLLGKTDKIWLLAVCGLLFVASVLTEDALKPMQYVQFIFLGAFHYVSQLNWSMVLYLVLMLLMIGKTPRAATVILTCALYILEYTAIRLSYQPITTYNLLVSIYDITAVTILSVIFRYVQRTQQVTKQLEEQANYLTTHDPLTGLLNYEGYIKALQEQVEQEKAFVLINFDLQDFRSFNVSGMSNGDEILSKLASTLKKMFKDALLLSRYAGDRFAVALQERDMLLPEIERLMNIKNLGFHVTYSVTQFPQEASSASFLITLAEDRLFQNKRKSWMQREEVRFQEEKLRMVGELAAGMAHEIRNPLTTIKGFMQLSKANEYITKPWHDLIMSEITRMSELTAEFLQFSKPHISNMKPEVIQACIDRVMFLTESEASLHGHVIVKKTIREELKVLADRDKIVQVLLNIVRNAFEAMKEAGTVQVEMTRDGNHCVIEIRDTGEGIAEEDLKKIFNPFYSTKENGTGLGLSICKKIIQDHGGSLDARSVPGEGSVFTVKLPLLQNQTVPAGQELAVSG